METSVKPKKKFSNREMSAERKKSGRQCFFFLLLFFVRRRKWGCHNVMQRYEKCEVDDPFAVTIFPLLSPWSKFFVNSTKSHVGSSEHFKSGMMKGKEMMLIWNAKHYTASWVERAEELLKPGEMFFDYFSASCNVGRECKARKYFKNASMELIET